MELCGLGVGGMFDAGQLHVDAAQHFGHQTCVHGAEVGEDGEHVLYGVHVSAQCGGRRQWQLHFHPGFGSHEFGIEHDVEVRTEGLPEAGAFVEQAVEEGDAWLQLLALEEGVGDGGMEHDVGIDDDGWEGNGWGSGRGTWAMRRLQ